LNVFLCKIKITLQLLRYTKVCRELKTVQVLDSQLEVH